MKLVEWLIVLFRKLIFVNKCSSRAPMSIAGMTHEQGCAIMSMIPPDKAGALLVGERTLEVL